MFDTVPKGKIWFPVCLLNIRATYPSLAFLQTTLLAVKQSKQIFSKLKIKILMAEYKSLACLIYDGTI